MRPRKVKCGSRPYGWIGKASATGKSATNAPCGSAGVETTAWIEGTFMKHGKPPPTVPKGTTEGPRGPDPVVSVAERLVVATKPGNSGGAKEPQFKDQRRQKPGRR